LTAGNGDRPGSGDGPERRPAWKRCRPGSGDREREEVAAMGLLIQLAFIACMIALLVFLIQQYRRGNRKD
jgi:hypothetical protein